MADATFADPDLTTFARLDGLGLQVVGQFLEPDRAVLSCRVVDPDDRCHRSGGLCRGCSRPGVRWAWLVTAAHPARHGAGIERRLTSMAAVAIYVGLVTANFIWLWPILMGDPITPARLVAETWLPSWG